MATYLYGLILSRNADSVPANVVDADGRAVRVARCDGLSAVVADVDKAAARDDVRAIAAHDNVLSQVVRHAVTVAASRFGQTFARDDALCAELAASPHRDRLIAMLERYDGYGEMRVIMHTGAEPPGPIRASSTPQPAPGRVYLESVRDRLKARPPVDFRALLGGLVLEERIERRVDIQTISHLVRFGDEAKYRAELYAHPALTGVRIVGPHALYTFAQPE